MLRSNLPGRRPRVHGRRGAQATVIFSIERKAGGMTLRTERILDDVGWRILHALQADARLSFSELGRRIGLSAPAVAERVRWMEEAGIITAYRVEVALDKLFPITAIIRVSAPEENCAQLGACVRELPEVGAELSCHWHRPSGPEGRGPIGLPSRLDHRAARSLRNAGRVDRP